MKSWSWVSQRWRRAEFEFATILLSYENDTVSGVNLSIRGLSPEFSAKCYQNVRSGYDVFLPEEK